MKICRFDDDRLGLVEGDRVRDVSAALDVVPTSRWPLPPGDPLIANLDAVIARIGEVAGGAEALALDGVALKSPVANPGKIVGAPINYSKHHDEAAKDKTIAYGRDVKSMSIGDMGLFLKATSALIGPGEGVAVRFPERRTDHEAELGLVIGKTTSSVSVSEMVKPNWSRTPSPPCRGVALLGYPRRVPPLARKANFVPYGFDPASNRSSRLSQGSEKRRSRVPSPGAS